jgi:hypothetical protein
MTIIQIVLGVAFAVLAVGALGLIALFFACDRAALYEKSKHENEKNH